MKNKYLYLTLTLILCGCNNGVVSSSSSSTKPSSSISKSDITNSSTSLITSTNKEEIEGKLIHYLFELKNSFPKYLTSDFVFPTIDDSSYKVEFKSSNTEIFQNILVYEDLGYDYSTNVSIKITKGIYSINDNVTIDIFSLVNPIGINFIKLDELIPQEITGDFFLPIIDDFFISWSTDYSYIYTHRTYENVNYNYLSSIETNRLVYDYPEEDQICNLTASIIKNNQKHNRVYSTTFKSNKNIEKLPKIEITTENNQAIVSKDDYLNATFKLTEYQNEEIITESEVKIKGRGNSTWSMPKKPYALKFDKKIQLLDGVKAKQWCLLANHADQSLMRNYLALTLGNKLSGLDWNPTPSYVDVYLNNEYQGNYVLTEKVGVGKERINVLEETFDVNSGYLIELDARASEEGIQNEDYFTLNEGAVNTYALKSPEKGDDYYSVDKLYYIQDYMQDALNAVKNDNYEDYIDIDSFVDWYIVNEVFQSVDAGYSSVYFNKDKDGKLKIGPLWDLDLSAGNPGHLESALRTPTGYYVARGEKNIWYYYLLNSKTFQEALKTRWNEVYDDLIYTLPLQVFEVSNKIGYSAKRNFEVWNNVLGQENEWYTAYETYVRGTYEEQLQFLHDFLKARISWLNSSINNNYFVH